MGVLVHRSSLELHGYIQIQAHTKTYYMDTITYTGTVILYHVLGINASITPQGVVHDVSAIKELSLPPIHNFGTFSSGRPFSNPSPEERFASPG